MIAFGMFYSGWWAVFLLPNSQSQTGVLNQASIHRFGRQVFLYNTLFIINYFFLPALKIIGISLFIKTIWGV